MSTTNANRLKKKLIEKRAINLGKHLSGISSFEIIEISPSDFEKHRQAIRNLCNINSTPEMEWEEDIVDSDVLDWLCARFEKLLRLDIYMPFEIPLIVKFRILDTADFVKSVWRFFRTRDLTIYTINPFSVIDLQDAEYKLLYFEITERHLRKLRS